ncbi:cobaltochelatase subunit CobN [Campylobacter sputorum]|uniref:cobaltochelatase subunit CobN n=1 Tax=Campylobacter sputorum TaxID=206 RepID=UPI00053BE0E7|nr:cobaltochelatase subunit CobN [Campylobacter sputorum]
MKIAIISWSNHIKLLQEISKNLDDKILSLSIAKFSMDEKRAFRKCEEIIKLCDIAIIARHGAKYDEDIDLLLKKFNKKAVFISSNTIFMQKGDFGLEAGILCQNYLNFLGKENGINLINYAKFLIDKKTKFKKPTPTKQEFAWHPKIGIMYDKDELWQNLKTFGFKRYIGVLTRNSNIFVNNLKLENAIVKSFEEKGVGVAILAYKVENSKDNISNIKLIEEFFCDSKKPKIQALIKLTSFLLDNNTQTSTNLLKKLNIPIINPIISYHKTHKEWYDDENGIAKQVSFSIAMPEFEGAIEPIIIASSDENFANDEISYSPIYDRLNKFTNRVLRWINLRNKPNKDKKVAFILNNDPCVGAESSVGGAANLDTLQSVAKILAKLKEEGYKVRVPKDGKSLIDEILSKKALSEFRFTSAKDIVKNGGALDLLETKIYKEWYDKFPQKTQDDISKIWGNPPGESKNSLPASMLYEGKIIISGLDFENAVVLVQPKRGCAGSACNGKVCLILHDPKIPPPHQYIATYKWLDKIFKADLIIHVGTHGNLEFLPGKSVSMSNACYSDICIGDIPNVYIYNCDNPVEAIIAKRRSYATTITHMQTTLSQSGLYGEFLELQKLLQEYEKFKNIEPSKAHSIEHMILSHKALKNLLGENFKRDENLFSKISAKLDELNFSDIADGMHVFGEKLIDEKKLTMIQNIIKWGLDENSIRGLIALNLDIDTKTCDEKTLNFLTKEANEIVKKWYINGVSLKDIINLDDKLSKNLETIEEILEEISLNLDSSDELKSLLNSFDGGFIPPSPSGLITRGGYKILPTGRNLYGLDAYSLPTKSAWEIGKKLADALLQNFKQKNKSYPKNIAFYWQCADLMWSNGEMFAQMLYLLGCEPIWDSALRVKKFKILDLDQLKRPRIDITVRVSGVTRDNFFNVIEILDEAICAVSKLDEDDFLNYVKLNTNLKQKEGLTSQNAQNRIFCAAPGTYQSGANLAIYASAWKNENDLRDIYLNFNSYAYGKDKFGIKDIKGFKSSLKSVEASFNKTSNDEYDLTGCSCYFGNHGGLISSANSLKKEKIQNYYGDTREQGRVKIRGLDDELRRVSRAKILNPKYIESMKKHGYKGASEISKRVTRVYGWQATSGEIDDEIFNDIARTFIINDENRKFFEKNNPYALEEMSRRLIEANARGLWNMSDDVKEALKDYYIQIEGWIEEGLGDGEVQGGSIDIFSPDDIDSWKEKLQDVR